MYRTYTNFIGVPLNAIYCLEIFQIASLMSLLIDCLSELCPPDLSSIVSLVEVWQLKLRSYILNLGLDTFSLGRKNENSWDFFTNQNTA